MWHLPTLEDPGEGSEDYNQSEDAESEDEDKEEGSVDNSQTQTPVQK